MAFMSFTGLRAATGIAAVIAAALTFALPASAEHPEPDAARIRIGGSGGALASMQILLEAFKKIHPHATEVIVPSLGSGGGIKAVRAGAIDLAVISRPLTDAERSQGAIGTEYARAPFVFATAAHTNVSAISTRELLSIYSGERKTWPDGRPLRLVLRPEADSDTDITKSLSPEMMQAVKTAHARAGMIIAPTDQASADSLETIRGSIGTTTLAQIISEKRALQALALNGVTPSLKTLADGKYPYYKTFIMVSDAKTSPLVQQFIAFVRSAAGQQILEENGHWVTPTK